MAGSQLRFCWSEAVCSSSGYRLMSAFTALFGHGTGTPATSTASLSGKFRKRSCFRFLVTS